MEKSIMKIAVTLLIFLTLFLLRYFQSRKIKKNNKINEELANKYAFEILDTGTVYDKIPISHSIFYSRPKTKIWKATEARCDSFLQLNIPGYEVFYIALHHLTVPEDSFNGAQMNLQALICNLEHDSPYIKIVKRSIWNKNAAMTYLDKPALKLKGERFPSSAYTLYSEEPLSREFTEFFMGCNKTLEKAGISIEISEGCIAFYKYGVSKPENFFNAVIPLLTACADLTPAKAAVPSEECEQIINFLNCGYELFKNEKRGDKIAARFSELSKEGQSAGFYPLIITPDRNLAEGMWSALENAGTGKEYSSIGIWRENEIKKAAEINAEDFLNARFKKYMQNYEGQDITGEFTECEPSDNLFSYMNGARPHKEVIIAKVPARNPWEIPLWLPMGGVNDCPSPYEQAAVFKYWYEKYGARPSAVASDIWELALTNPPRTNKEAEALANEQFAFCSDIVMQETEEIRGLASSLKNSKAWHFWWD